MYAVIVYHPVRLTVRRNDIHVQALLLAGDLADSLVEAFEDRKIRVTPRRSSHTREARHVVWAQEYDDGLDMLSHAAHEMDQPLSKKIEWRASSCVVEPVGDDEQIRPVSYHVLVETLFRGRFSAVLIAGATG